MTDTCTTTFNGTVSDCPLFSHRKPWRTLPIYTGNAPGSTANFGYALSQFDDPISVHEYKIGKQIDEVSLPFRWLREGVASPSRQCLENAKRLAKKLLKDFALPLAKAQASIEEGVMLTYRNTSSSLKIELYNDGDIAGVVNRNRSIVFSTGILSEKDYACLVEHFKTK